MLLGPTTLVSVMTFLKASTTAAQGLAFNAYSPLASAAPLIHYYNPTLAIPLLLATVLSPASV